MYITRNSWYRSVTTHELNLVPDAFEPFNSIPNPARPQQMEDMHNNPLFVMKVGVSVCYHNVLSRWLTCML